MADQFATPEELASALQSDLDLATATLWLNATAAVVQEAAGGQRILRVTNDILVIGGRARQWLDLPQIPVVSVATVVMDGTTLTVGTAGSVNTTYRLVGNRLWRGAGWQTYYGEPSSITVTNTHGYASGSQDLELARAASLAIAKVAYSNPSGATSEKIDDYAVVFEKAAAAMDATPSLRAALRRKYGRRGGLVSLGN